MIDRFKMYKFQFLIIWLVLTSHLISTQSIKPIINDQNILTTTTYDDNQLINTIGNDDCGCLTNYEIKITTDTMFTGQLIRCTNVKKFNQLNLIDRISVNSKCLKAEQQFGEIIITNNKFRIWNSTLLQNLNFTIKADLSHNGIEKIDPFSFSSLTSLKHLDLSGNNLKQLNSNLFDGLISLVKLNLTGNQILNIEDFTFKSLSNLVNLDLSLNHLVGIKRNAFIGLESLTQLNLASNYIQSLEEGVFNDIISKVRKIRLQNNQIICDCNLAWLIKDKERYNKNLIGKLMCSPAYQQPRVKLSSVTIDHMVCGHEIHLNKFELNIPNNLTIMKTGEPFEFECKAIDGKPFTSIKLYRNDYLISESSNYINYLADQFMNTTSILSTKNLVEFKKSIINLNNFTMNSIEQRLIIYKLNLNDNGVYTCIISTPFGNSSRKFQLKILQANATIYQQFIDLIKVPNFIMIFNSSLILIAILIYLTNYNSIEMNNKLKYIQLHLWLQILILINLFYYSSTKHFSAIKYNCELYGLIIYYFMISIFFTILILSIYLYKQLTECTINSLNKTISNKNKSNQPYLNNQHQFNLQNENYQTSIQQHQQSQYNDELFSEQILMYQTPQQSKNYCLKFIRFLFNHYTIRYHALNTSLTVLVVLVFGLFNLNQFKTNSRCFANILLVSNFYIFIPFLMLIIGQFGMFIVLSCAIKRFYMMHKKLEQRDTLKEHVLDQQHSTHVNNCLPCFKAYSKLDMYWNSSKHQLAITINFIFYLILLILIILTTVNQDTNYFKNELSLSPSVYWWLPNSIILNNRNSTENNQIKNLKDQIQASEMRSSLDDFKLTNQTNKKIEKSTETISFKMNSSNLFDEQLLISLYLVFTFLICVHILIHYCLARKDVRELLKSFFIKTFCIYGCDFCFNRQRCCNTNQTNNKQQLHSKTTDRYHTSTLVPGIILNSNVDAQSSLLFNPQSQKSSFYQQQLQYGIPSKEQPLLYEEKDEDELYEQTDNSQNANNSSRLTNLDGFDLLPTNGLYKLGNENIDFRNGTNSKFKSTVNTYQDGITTVRLLNDQLLSSESNTTTSSTIVTNGGSMSNSALSNHNDMFNLQTNNNQQQSILSKPKTNIICNKEHIYYETVNSNLKKFKAPFDDTFLEGDGSFLQNPAEKAKSDIVIMNRKLKKRSSLNTKQKPRCIDVKYRNHFDQQQNYQNQQSSNLMIDNQSNRYAFDNYPNKTNFQSTSTRNTNRPMITTKIEREFLNNQLKKYGSDTLDKIDYLPPVCKRITPKSVQSQPVTFSNNKNYPNRFKSSNQTKEEFNFNNHQISNNFNLSSSYNNNFNNLINQQQAKDRKFKTSNPNKSYLENTSRPLLVCGPDSKIENDNYFMKQNYENQQSTNIYEKIPCKKYADKHKTIIEQDSEDNLDDYDNLDDNLTVNFQNSNRLFLSNNKGYENIPRNIMKRDELRNSNLNSPTHNATSFLNNINLNISRKSPNLINRSDFTIRSNNSNRSNNSSNSKKSNQPINSSLLSDFNETNQFERNHFNRSTTSSKTSDDIFLNNHNLNKKRIIKNEQLNLIMNRNENGQINLEMISSSSE